MKSIYERHLFILSCPILIANGQIQQLQSGDYSENGKYVSEPLRYKGLSDLR